jgi:hypothetical protein
MIMLAICSMLIGSALAIRFRFIVLLPIIFLGSIVLVTISAFQNGLFSQMALMVIVFGTSLQLGYVFAVACHDFNPEPDTLATAEKPEITVGVFHASDPKPSTQAFDSSLGLKPWTQALDPNHPPGLVTLPPARHTPP